MKHLFIITILCIVAATSDAQLKIYPNGYMAVSTDEIPQCPIAINTQGNSNFFSTLKADSQSGLLCIASTAESTDNIFGISSMATPMDPTSSNSIISYGLSGMSLHSAFNIGTMGLATATGSFKKCVGVFGFCGSPQRANYLVLKNVDSN